MSVDIKKLGRLYTCAGEITSTSRWDDLEKVLKKYKRLLVKRWDVAKLKELHGNNRGYASVDAKVRVLSDPAFKYIVAFHSDRKFRSGDKYKLIFDDITNTPIEIEELRRNHDFFGLHVISQHKRYDPFPDRGKIYTKKKENGKRYIWREKEE